MIRALVRLFVKDADNISDPSVRERYGMLSGTVGIILNLCLSAGKFFAGVLTGSIAITADAFNNLSDAASSVVTLIGFKMAGQKPDRDHPFGHGRIEYLSGLLISLVILVMGFELGKSSVEKILSPAPVDFSVLSLVILAVSIAVKLWMYFFNRKVGNTIDSSAMRATAMDSLSDSVATSTVLICSLLGRLLDLQVDGWAGVLVALFILYTGVRAAKDTIDPLLGQTPDPEFVRGIENEVMGYKGIVGIHDLLVHDYGPGRCVISLHAEVPCDANILDMHDTIDLAERKIKEKFRCEAVIHMDPIATDDEETNKMKNEVAALVKLIDPTVSIHDFRMVVGPTHTNLIFDVVLPVRFRLSDDEVTRSIQNALHAVDQSYFAVISVDRAYT